MRVRAKKRVRQKARLEVFLLGAVTLMMFSCSSPGGSSSPYDQSYIEFRLSGTSRLGYDDLQSIKVYVDSDAAFNLLNMFENGRSVLGAYDYNSGSQIYMGFEYSPLYICRLENLRVSVTRKGTQEFIDSGNYTLTFQGELPEAPEDKPFIEISITDPPAGSTLGVTLTALPGSPGAPQLTLTP